jgi:hypothetical protein
LFSSSAFATNKDIRCHFGSSTTSKSDMSSYRFSEGSSLFRKSVLHRIRFGNTLRLKAEFPNSAASSLRTNDLPGSDRRPSRSLSAYPDQWTYHHHHRRLSNTPRMPVGTASADDLSYRTSLFSQKMFENMPPTIEPPVVPPPPIPTPILSSMDISELENNERSLMIQQHESITHLPDCMYATNQSNTTNSTVSNDVIRQRRKSTRKSNKSNSNNDLSLSMKIADIDSESSSAWTNEGTTINTIPTTTTSATLTNSEPICTCQLLWQLERETDSIDKFKLFFKRDHLNVDWDYVQGSSEV